MMAVPFAHLPLPGGWWKMCVPGSLQLQDGGGGDGKYRCRLPPQKSCDLRPCIAFSVSASVFGGGTTQITSEILKECKNEQFNHRGAEEHGEETSRERTRMHTN